MLTNELSDALVPRRGATGGPICGRPPCPQEFCCVNPIACDHMSGLLSRSHMTAAKMGSATRGPNSTAACSPLGPSGFLASEIDRSHSSTRASSASSIRCRPHAELGYLVDWLAIILGTIGRGGTTASLTSMAAHRERLGQARSRLTAGHRRRRRGLDGACPALDCPLTERSVAAWAAGDNAPH